MRRAFRVGAVVALAVLSAPLPSSGQGPTLARPCPYDECALRLWDTDLLEGREAESIARFGFFRPPAVRELLGASDSASGYLDVVEEHYTSGRVIWFMGQAASLAGLVMYCSSDPAVQRGGFAAQTAGFLFAWVGQRRVTTAREAMSRAVWWYNRDVAAGRAPTQR